MTAGERRVNCPATDTILLWHVLCSTRARSMSTDKVDPVNPVKSRWSPNGGGAVGRHHD